jgi:A/G-specific adenine glycosylase
MHATAKHIAQDLGGRFPDTYAGIRSLRGVGDYTAAAIAAFAYDLPHAVLDGNVYRVLARYCGIDMSTDTPAAKRLFGELAQQMLDANQPGVYNQAIMDFGATHCTPQQPRCGTCPVQSHCVAYRDNRVADLPVRARKPGKKARFFLYAVIWHRGTVLVRKRQEKDIWQDLYEFPMLEVPVFPEDNRSLELQLAQHFWGADPTAGIQCTYISGPYRQALTHQLITAAFCEFEVPDVVGDDFFQQTGLALNERMALSELKKNIAVPRVIALYLQKKATTLSLF